MCAKFKINYIGESAFIVNLLKNDKRFEINSIFCEISGLNDSLEDMIGE